MTKKIFAMFLAVLMVISVLPTSVFAANECPGAGKHTKSNCDCTVIEVTEPTCGEAGFTTYQCKKCKEVFADDMKPATGVHNMVAGEALAPTCGVAGYEAGTECEDCGLVIPGAAIAPVVKAGISCEYKDMTPDIDCTTGGTKTFECVVCHDTYTKKIDKGAHTWNFGKFTVKVAPTAEAAGAILIPCDDCSATKEIEWFGDHNCSESVQLHDEVLPTCTTNGEIAHYECRVCGKIYADAACKDELRANEYADSEAAYVGYEGHGIITLGGHSLPAGVTVKCTEQTVKCPVCEEKWTVPGMHSFVTQSSVPATCVTPGYTTKVCSVCGLPSVKTTDAQGHIAKTVSVPATCGTFAYTFTYCLREDCAFKKYENATQWTDEAGIPYSVKVGYTVADQFLAGGVVAYNLSLTQKNLNKVLYLTGNMSGYYLETTDNAANAAAVELIAVEDYKGDVIKNAFIVKLGNKYINVYEFLDGDPGYGSIKASPELVDTAAEACVFMMNETTGVMTVTLTYGEYFLCAYNKYTTVGASSVSYLDSSFAAVLNFVTIGGVDLIADPVVNEDAGYDLNNHNYVVTKTPATCAQKGEKVTTCANYGCDYHVTEEIAVVDHKTKDLTNSAADIALIIEKTGDSVNADTVSKAETCTTAGYKYVQCEYCQQVFKKTIAAEGHYFKTKYAPKYQAASHTSDSYYYWECSNGCGERQKINVTPWKDAGKTFDTYEEALAAHPGIGAENTGVLYRDGNCTTAGLIKFVCNGTDKCGKVVYVKQWKTLKDKNGNPVKDPATNLDIVYMTGQHTVKSFQLTEDVVIDANLTLAAGSWIVDKTLPMYNVQPIALGDTMHHYAMDPTCSSKGYIFTYECACCGEVVGSTQKGTAKTIAAVEHYYIVPNAAYDYDVNPCPNGVPYKCYWCGADKIVKAPMDTTSNLCTSYRFEYYECTCGEEHIRGMYGKFGHELVNLIGYTKPTHTTYGSATYKCTYCSYEKTYTLDKTPHENKAEEEFTDKCTDTETDRHCVLCCVCADKGDKHDCTKKNNQGKYDCDCMIPSVHHWAVSTLMDSSCTMVPYQIKVCNDCNKQSVETASTFLKNAAELEAVLDTDGSVLYYNIKNESEFYVVDEDDNTTVTDVTLPIGKVNFKGHKPAEVDYKKNEDGTFVYENGKKVEVRYGNYVYVENYTWTSYEWVVVNVPYVVIADYTATGFPIYETKHELQYVLLETVETYTAKFEKYTEETYSTDGYFKAYCQICDAVVEQVNAKKAGIGFEMDFANANGANGYGYGSLVEVTVSLNALNASVYGFEFNVVAPGMVFVGYELANEDFSVTVTNPKVAAKEGLKIVGHAVNTLEGKMQNISVTEKTALVKLYFRAMGAGKINFTFANASAQKVENATAKTLANIDANYEDAYIKVRGMLDFNNDNAATAADLYQAMSLLTGEHPNGLVYDVTVDLNKDGEVTLEDLSIGYNYLVGNVKAIELLIAGMSDAELDLFMTIFGAYQHECKSPFCSYAQDEAFAYCPACGFRQN